MVDKAIVSEKSVLLLSLSPRRFILFILQYIHLAPYSMVVLTVSMFGSGIRFDDTFAVFKGSVI